MFSLFADVLSVVGCIVIGSVLFGLIIGSIGFIITALVVVLCAAVIIAVGGATIGVFLPEILIVLLVIFITKRKNKKNKEDK